MSRLERSASTEDVQLLSPIEWRIAARLRARRRLLGLTLEQVGAAADMSFRRVHKYESGAVRISAANLWRLANALDVEVNYFFDDPAEALAREHGRDRQIDGRALP
jgi:transcriptional regulator with XRE-family HTH domain